MLDTLLWSGACFFGLRSLGRVRLPAWGASFQTMTERLVISRLQELEETLQAGRVASDALWDRLCHLPSPWDELVGRRLLELKRAGVALLPTVQRLKMLALFMIELKATARVRSSQAWAQAWICLFLVPVMALALGHFLPGLSHPLWWMLSGFSTALCAGGAIWIRAIARTSAWGRLPTARQSWILDSQVSLETLLSRTRSGSPADMAWNHMVEGMSGLGLARYWKASVWALEDSVDAGVQPGLESLLVGAGSAIRRALQTSLMEGRPCSQRIEAALDSLRTDIRALIHRELELLPSRALKPLFICVAPAILLLVFSSVGIVAMQGFDL